MKKFKLNELEKKALKYFNSYEEFKEGIKRAGKNESLLDYLRVVLNNTVITYNNLKRIHDMT